MATLDQRVADLETQLAALNTPTNAAIANQMAALLTAWQAREDQLRTWLAGVAAGGPNANGTYPLTDASGFVRQVSCPDQIRADSAKFLGGTKAGVGPFTMLASESGRFWAIGNGSATVNVSVRLPDAGLWTQFMFQQSGSGRLIFSSATGGSVVNRQGFTRSAGQTAIVVAICTSLDANGHSIWTLGGDMSLTNT
jgi:hypothetical protein